MATKSKAKKPVTPEPEDPATETYAFYDKIKTQCKARLNEEQDPDARKALSSFISLCDKELSKAEYDMAVKQEEEAVDEMIRATQELAENNPAWTRLTLFDACRQLPIGVGLFIRKPSEEPSIHYFRVDPNAWVRK